jgi:hypothetical protein
VGFGQSFRRRTKSEIDSVSFYEDGKIIHVVFLTSEMGKIEN